ncbi:MAG TPA: shikimate dehydrogenase [Rhizomicrobium sp.]|jgi:shikimate dehydrogenase|nr:shikimate dehydrogenase [Rhizomicrobium sp.]
MTVSGKALCAGVAGWPVSHSLSPRLHNHWLRAHGVDGAYVPLAIAREHLAEALKGLRLAGFKGVNLTIPHKEAAFALAHELDAAAQAAGAVNLLIFKDDGTLEGRNTDAEGLAESLRVAGVALSGKPATLLGAGGAARAAILALDASGAGEIRILNRHPDRAAVLANALAPFVKAKLKPAAMSDWPATARDAGLLVNATSAGMKDQPALDLPLDPLPTSAAVCDLIYNPLETALLKNAKARGHKTVDGLGMLMYQAAPSFAAFYGVTPKVTPELRGELERALQA